MAFQSVTLEIYEHTNQPQAQIVTDWLENIRLVSPASREGEIQSIRCPLPRSPPSPPRFQRPSPQCLGAEQQQPRVRAQQQLGPQQPLVGGQPQPELEASANVTVPEMDRNTVPPSSGRNSINSIEGLFFHQQHHLLMRLTHIRSC
jgi:hypothetical protein